MTIKTRMFRESDVRDVVPEQIDAAWARRFGEVLAKLAPSSAFGVGYDTRITSPELAEALRHGLSVGGAAVVDLGVCPTEIVAYAVATDRVSFGIMVTASHNPEPDNGFKLFPSKALALPLPALLATLKRKMSVTAKREGLRLPLPAAGVLNLIPEFVERVASLVELSPSEGIVALNGLNGTAALVAQPLAEHLDLSVRWCSSPEEGLPREGPDPMKPRLLEQMSSFTQEVGANLGVVWDGDCDRCVFFDESGRNIPSAYVMSMMTDYFLAGTQGQHIVHDSKLLLSIQRAISRHAASSSCVGTGSGNMRAAMQTTQAIYGGESSAHHYFGKMHGFDSGMLSWLTMLDLLSRSGKSLKEVTAGYRSEVAVLPEVSVHAQSIEQLILALEAYLSDQIIEIETQVGRAYHLAEGMRFSINPSTTEPVLRLNFESCGSPKELVRQADDIVQRVWQHEKLSHAGPPTLKIV